MIAADRPRKINLIIEDNGIAREGLVVVLRRHGYDAVAATDGGAALALLADGLSPDLILLDMLLPDVDGWAFLSRLELIHARPVPIVVTTGINLSREWAESHGCCGFLKKPYNELELLNEIERCLAAG
jgi:CheY-like chemotaxis protein